jgi:type VI protein secretion system component Hcp
VRPAVELLESRILLSVPTHIVFGQQPTDTVAGKTINPAVSVLLEDQFNHVVTSSDQNVSLAVQNNPNGGTLSGTTSQTASGGVATFNDLSIDQAGAGYTLAASALVSCQPTPNMGATFDTGSGVIGGEIPVTSFGWNGQSSATARASVSDFQLVLDPGSAEPDVWGVIVSNRIFSQVVLHVRNGAGTEYLTYKFDNVAIRTYDTASPGGVQDAITLDFGTVEEDFAPVLPDGTLGTPVTVSYDRTAGGGASTIPGPGLITATVVSAPFNVTNVIPMITSLSPASVQEGSGATTVTVTGSNFVNGATVQLNGTSFAASFVDSSHLQVTVAASFFAEETAITITVTNPVSTGPSNALVLTVSDAPLTASATIINATEGAAVSKVLVATFTDEDPAGVATDYRATIDWRDGDSTVPGSVNIQADAQVAGQFDVHASKTHPYAEEGSQIVKVTITDNQASDTANSTASIADAALISANVTVSPTAGAPFSGVVASFADSDPQGTLADYSATISWGDGNSSLGVVTMNGTGGFQVSGTNTYAAAGSYTVSVKFMDAGGASATAASLAKVANLGIGVQKGQAADIGFWANQNGQTLIDSFNGGATSKALGNWLAATFANIYGANAGTHNLAGKTNAEVAAFYASLFNRTGPRVDAYVLDTALDVYATTLSLGGTAAKSYGFLVTAAGLGASSYNVGFNGAAFGVPNSTTLSIYQILKAANKQAVNGVLYNGNVKLLDMALNVFSGIDLNGGFE